MEYKIQNLSVIHTFHCKQFFYLLRYLITIYVVILLAVFVRSDKTCSKFGSKYFCLVIYGNEFLIWFDQIKCDQILAGYADTHLY